MGTKNNPGKFDCHAAAEPDEPTFTLLARDPMFGPLVRQWARERERAIDADIKPDTPEEREQISEALDAARAGEDWRRKNRPPHERKDTA